MEQLTIEQLVEKYKNIEDKIPSVWKNWFECRKELEYDIVYTWNINNSELYRNISLVGLRTYPTLSTESLYSHLDFRFSYMGLYPEIQKSFNIKPELNSIYNDILFKRIKNKLDENEI